jgi:protein-disulfide isomerase
VKGSLQVKSVLSTAGTVLSVACAVVVTVLLVRREFFPPPPPTPAGARPDSTLSSSDWAQVREGTLRIGPVNAPLEIVEFADFECPACRSFQLRSLGPIRRTYPNDVAVVFRHWPLAYHRFALPSARAAECAAAQGRFEEIHDLMYLKQDSLGLKSYAEFAAESGVKDLTAFGDCLADPRHAPRFEADTKLATGMGGTGTPTIIVNGRRLGSIPDSTRLDRMVQDARASQLANRR